MALEKVTMRHPDIGAEASVARKAYEATWKDRGWELVEGEVKVDVPSEPEDTGSVGEVDTWDIPDMSSDE